MNYILSLFFFMLTLYPYAQTWDSNYYDKKVLYDNADLLQLNEYEKLKLKSQEIERNKIIPKDDVDFYDLDIVNEVDTNTYFVNDVEQENQKMKKKVEKNYSFSKVVTRVNLENVTDNIDETEKIYFIDF